MKNHSLISTQNVKKLLCFASVALGLASATAQTVTPWLTKGDQSALLSQQGTVNFAANSGSNANTITVNAGTTYQTIDGYGWTLTDGSAQVISGLNATTQNNLLQELFNPSTGLSSNLVRISIGSSDLSQYTYSYDDTYGDTALNNFSLNGFTMDYTVPILKKILAINPNIKILATPWSAPYWMKTNNGWVGGSLLTANYGPYANYFIKYLQAMQAQGIKIWAVTPQNEPENPYNEPSMTMNSTEQKNFINNNLGPALMNAGFGYVKIIAFDHNCDNTAYPIDVLNNSSYVDGAAFHLYGAGESIAGMGTVHNSTGKNVYFTEQYVGGPGNFGGDFGWHMKYVVIGSMNNWSKTAMSWNLATNTSYGPHTSGGCSNCMGAITITSSGSYTRNSPYYIIGQISKFVKNGAVRIGSSSSNGNLSASAFKNNDGSVVLVVYNSSSSALSTKIVSGSNAFTYSIPASSAISFKWTEGSTQGYPGYYNIISRLSNKGLDVADNSTASGANIQQWDITGGGGNNQRWRFESAGNNQYYIRVKSTNMYLALASTSTADGIKVQQKSFVNNDTYKWIVTSVGSGYYKIENVYSSKALDVTDVSTANGALIQVWAYGGGTNQQWSFTQVENSAKPGNQAGLNAEATEASFTLYPNPAKETVTLVAASSGQYTITGLTGNIVAKGDAAKGENNINISHLAAGYYLISMQGENGALKTLKLLKQ